MKQYTLQDIKDAYEDGYYEGAGDDAWYNDHDSSDDSTLNSDAMVNDPRDKFIAELLKRNANHVN